MRRSSFPRRLATLLLVSVTGCRHVLQPTAIEVGPARELLVRVFLNDTPAMLQLDTGSSTTSLTPAARQRLGLGTWVPAAGGGAGGDLPHAEWVMVRRVKFAGAITHSLAVAVIDLDAAGGVIDGVLGMDMLGEYTIEVDLRAHRVVLHHEGDTSFRSAELVATPYRPLGGGQIALAITLEGRPATAVLDLGANRTFANTRTGLVPDDAESTISAVIGADRHRLKFRAASEVRLGFGDLALQARSVWIADLPIFRTFGLADRPAVVLGTDVLADHRIVIDPFARRVYLSR